MVDRLLEMAKEQSTWKGVISLITAAGVVITPAQSAAIIAGGMALIGLINVFRRETKTDTVAQ